MVLLIFHTFLPVAYSILGNSLYEFVKVELCMLQQIKS